MKKKFLIYIYLTSFLFLSACSQESVLPLEIQSENLSLVSNAEEITSISSASSDPLPPSEIKAFVSPVETPQEEAFVSTEPDTPCELAHSSRRQFLPVTTKLTAAQILPAQDNECGFYNWALQAFLFETQPDLQKKPAFVHYESFENVFDLSSTGEVNGRLTLNAGVSQAGEKAAVLVDKNHNPVYYSIHINTEFSDFVKKEELNNAQKLITPPSRGGVSASLEFPPGVVEMKAAWQVIEPGADYSRYIVLPARVPVLKNNEGLVVPSGTYRNVDVALLSLHVVGTVQDHPEFIWATFEHINPEGQPDLAPSAIRNPLFGVPQVLTNLEQDYPLYSPHTPTNSYSPQSINEVTQKFSSPTSVHRVFPGSVSTHSKVDPEISDLNTAVTQLFEKTDPMSQDPRRFYRMVGAIWLDNPGSQNRDGVFKSGRVFENTQDSFVLAGDDALSSMAMESFTQESQPNCFSCHNTLSKSIGQGITLPPRRVNISNVLTYYLQNSIASNTD